MGYMSVRDENFPRAQGVLWGKLRLFIKDLGLDVVRKGWGGSNFSAEC